MSFKELSKKYTEALKKNKEIVNKVQSKNAIVGDRVEKLYGEYMDLYAVPEDEREQYSPENPDAISLTLKGIKVEVNFYKLLNDEEYNKEKREEISEKGQEYAKRAISIIESENDRMEGELIEG